MPYPISYLCAVIKTRLLNWFFYGHLLIALAAAGLGWLSIQLIYGPQPWASEWPVVAYLFFATLGIYTLHRHLSFRRAGIRPTTLRYNIVDRHPDLSMAIGIGSLVIAVVIGLPFLEHMWTTLLWAAPLTVFYLTPPIKGWRRLRDLPFVKVIWVAWAWTLMTETLPIDVMSALIREEYVRDNQGINFLVSPAYPQRPYPYEMVFRFFLTGSIAILFDFRDVVLDRSQGVKTIANSFPQLARWLVTLFMVGNIAGVWLVYGYPLAYSVLGSIAYLAVIFVAWRTHVKRSEDWYAVVVNGLLLGPVVAMVVAVLLG